MMTVTHVEHLTLRCFSLPCHLTDITGLQVTPSTPGEHSKLLETNTHTPPPEAHSCVCLRPLFFDIQFLHLFNFTPIMFLLTSSSSKTSRTAVVNLPDEHRVISMQSCARTGISHRSYGQVRPRRPTRDARNFDRAQATRAIAARQIRACVDIIPKAPRNSNAASRRAAWAPEKGPRALARSCGRIPLSSFCSSSPLAHTSS